MYADYKITIDQVETSTGPYQINQPIEFEVSVGIEDLELLGFNNSSTEFEQEYSPISYSYGFASRPRFNESGYIAGNDRIRIYGGTEYSGIGVDKFISFNNHNEKYKINDIVEYGDQLEIILDKPLVADVSHNENISTYGAATSNWVVDNVVTHPIGTYDIPIKNGLNIPISTILPGQTLKFNGHDTIYSVDAIILDDPEIESSILNLDIPLTSHVNINEGITFFPAGSNDWIVNNNIAYIPGTTKIKIDSGLIPPEIDQTIEFESHDTIYSVKSIIGNIVTLNSPLTANVYDNEKITFDGLPFSEDSWLISNDNKSYEAGTSIINLIGGTSIPIAGELITFNNHNKAYVISNVESGSLDHSTSPALLNYKITLETPLIENINDGDSIVFDTGIGDYDWITNNNFAYFLGDSEINIDGGIDPPKIGETITFNNHDYTYNILAVEPGPKGYIITLNEPLTANILHNDDITFNIVDGEDWKVNALSDDLVIPEEVIKPDPDLNIIIEDLIVEANKDIVVIDDPYKLFDIPQDFTLDFLLNNTLTASYKYFVTFNDTLGEEVINKANLLFSIKEEYEDLFELNQNISAQGKISKEISITDILSQGNLSIVQELAPSPEWPISTGPYSVGSKIYFKTTIINPGIVGSGIPPILGVKLNETNLGIPDVTPGLVIEDDPFNLFGVGTDLDPGEEVSVIYSYELTLNDFINGNATEITIVTSDQFPDKVSDPLTLDLTISQAELDIIFIETNPHTYLIGEPISYSLSITNNGNSEIYNFNIEEALAPITNLNGDVNIFTNPSGVILPSGGTVSVTYDYILTLDDAIAYEDNNIGISNDITIRGDNLNTSLFSPDDIITIGSLPNVQLSWDIVRPTIVDVGQPVTYEITMQNVGDNSATNVIFSNTTTRDTESGDVDVLTGTTINGNSSKVLTYTHNITNDDDFNRFIIEDLLLIGAQRVISPASETIANYTGIKTFVVPPAVLTVDTTRWTPHAGSFTDRTEGFVMLPIINATNANQPKELTRIWWGDNGETVKHQTGPNDIVDDFEDFLGKDFPAHTYDTPGVYTIEIEGNIEAWTGAYYYDDNLNQLVLQSSPSTGYYRKYSSTSAWRKFTEYWPWMVSIDSWGKLEAEHIDIVGIIGWCNAPGFGGSLATNIESSVFSMRGFAQNFDYGFAYDSNSNGSAWLWDSTFRESIRPDVGGVNNNLIPDITGLDVSNVTNFTYAFLGQEQFNQDISGWTISAATSLQGMFSASKFDNGGPQIGYQITGNAVGDLTIPVGSNPLSWGNSTASVTNMQYVFYDAESFNQNVASWDVSSVTNLGYMFRYAKEFNNGSATNDGLNPLSWTGNRAPKKCVYLRWLFADTDKFNQDLNDWEINACIDTSYMFYKALRFNNGKDHTDILQVNPLKWYYTNNLANVSHMFRDGVFNQSIFNPNDTPSGSTIADVAWFDMSAIDDMSYCFYNNDIFNRNISGWNIAGVKDLNYCFSNTASFNNGESSGQNGAPILWGAKMEDTDNVTGMFQVSGAFNQDISNWKITNLRYMSSFTSSATAWSSDNYGAALVSFSNQADTTGVRNTVSWTLTSPAEAALSVNPPAQDVANAIANLEDNYNWNISES